MIQDKTSSGMYEFACGAMVPSVSLRSYRLSNLKQNVFVLKRQRFVIRIESNAWLQATLFLQNFCMSY